MKLIAALVFSIVAFLSVAQAATIKGIKYRPELGQSSPALDIYTFKGAKNAPVLVYVHGGAWQFGSRSRVGAKPGYFNRKGFVFISIDYRLVPRVKVEDQLQDVDRALGWVARNIARFGGNPKNLHLMGHSAGAHLVAMTGVKPGRQARRLVASGALRSIIANDTLAYDLPGIAALRGGKLFRLHQRPFGNNKARWRRLSPLYQVGGRKPAFLLLYSGARPASLRRQQAENFAARLRRSGGRVQVHGAPNLSHRQINAKIGQGGALTGVIARFLAKN